MMSLFGSDAAASEKVGCGLGTRDSGRSVTNVVTGKTRLFGFFGGMAARSRKPTAVVTMLGQSLEVATVGRSPDRGSPAV